MCPGKREKKKILYLECVARKYKPGNLWLILVRLHLSVLKQRPRILYCASTHISEHNAAQ